MNIEKRRYERFYVPMNIEIRQFETGDSVYSGTTLNLSRSGVCMKTDVPATGVNGAVELTVSMPGSDESVPAVGDIVWAEHSGSCSRIGIRLVAMEQSEKLRLLDYCERQ